MAGSPTRYIVKRQHSGSVWRPSPPPIKGLRMAHARANARSRKRTHREPQSARRPRHPRPASRKRTGKGRGTKKCPLSARRPGNKPSQAKNPRTRHLAGIFQKWRDADSNRGHHDFQKARKARSKGPICKTSTGSCSPLDVHPVAGAFSGFWYRQWRPVPVGQPSGGGGLSSDADGCVGLRRCPPDGPATAGSVGA
jgi:hypothetical protein